MKQIIIHKQLAERVVKGNSQYWRHRCQLSLETIWDEEREGEEVISDIKIPQWCKLDNY